MLDLDAIRQRASIANAANLLTERSSKCVARPANLLTPISKVATLATLASVSGVGQRLTDAIDRCCNLRGDEDDYRAALLAECTSLTNDGQTDMLQHFEAEASRWEAANRGMQP